MFRKIATKLSGSKFVTVPITREPRLQKKADELKQWVKLEISQPRPRPKLNLASGRFEVYDRYAGRLHPLYGG